MSAAVVNGAGTKELHQLLANPPADDAPGSEWLKWFRSCAWAATPKGCSGGGCRRGQHGNPGCAQNPSRGAHLAELAMAPQLRLRLHLGLRNPEVTA